jgi:uncharacterized protein (TIGR03435 family)
LPVYVVTVGKNGPTFPHSGINEADCKEPSAGNAQASSSFEALLKQADETIVCHRFLGGRGRGLHGRAVTMGDLVKFVEGWTDRPVVDGTGLKDLYRIETGPWLPMDVGSTRTNIDGVDVADLPTIFTVFDQMGLKLVAQKRRIDAYVIDRIEKPTED